MGRGNPQEVEWQEQGATLQCMGDSAKTTPVHDESLWHVSGNHVTDKFIMSHVKNHQIYFVWDAFSPIGW